MTASQPEGYRFDGFRIDRHRRQLIGTDGEAVALTGKAFDVLLYLVEHAQQVISKDELLAQVWAGRVVDENNLTQAISALRKALGADPGDHRFILTEARRGYRFVAELRDEAGPRQELPGIPHRNRASHRPIIAIAIPILIALLALAWQRLEPERDDREAELALAVLPFRPIGEAPPDDLLELGLVDTLITQLSRSSALSVRSLASSRRVSADDLDALEAGRKLRANHVLAGSTQRKGSQLRINVQLLEVASGRTVWADTFDAHPSEMFALQDRIATAVASALDVGKLPARFSSACDGADPQAHRAYLTGRQQASRPDSERLEAALTAFQRAVDLDPTCAPAYAGMASAYRGLVNIGERDPRQLFPLAKAAAEHALRIDPSSAEAHFAKASILFRYDWNLPAAESSYQRALMLNSSLADAHYGYSTLLITQKRLDEAVAHARQASASDPLSPLAHAVEAYVLAAAGQDDAAALPLQRALELQPDFSIAWLYRGEIALERGDVARAIADLGQAVAHSNGNTRALAMLGVAHAAAGDHGAAREVLRTLQTLSISVYQPATSQAAVYNALGNTGRAMELLEKAYVERDVRLSFLSTDANWNNLRAHPRFQALQRKMKLQP